MSWVVLFVYSALASTLLPGGSELLFSGMLIDQPSHGMWLWVVASTGNSVGAIITFFMGNLIALWRARSLKEGQGWQNNGGRLESWFALSQHRVAQLNRYGMWVLLLSWLPIIGDGLCLAAGYLGWKKRYCFGLIFLGKSGRYGVLWFFLV